MPVTRVDDRSLPVCICLGLLFCLVGDLGAVERDLSSFAYDKWRWREVKQISEIPILSVAESPAGVLWMAGDEGLYAYDGYQARPFPVPEEAKPIRSVVVVAEDQVHYLGDRIWGRVYEGAHEVIATFEAPLEGSRLTADARGNVYLGTSEGLLRHTAKGLEAIPTVFDRVENVACAANGEIWISEAGTGSLAVYEMPRSEGSDPVLLQRLKVSVPLRNSPFQLFPDSTGRVWVISENPETPPLYFTSDYAEVVLDDLRTLGGSNVLSGFAESRDGSIWISARRFIHRFSSEGWEVLDSEYLEIPTSFPLLHTLNDGSLLVTGRREKAMILNHNAARIDGFKGLHFHGEDRRGDRWFISQEGLVGRLSSDGTEWTWFSAEDGIPAMPNQLFFSSEGSLWAAGSHSMSASVARFDGEEWNRDLFAEMGYRIGHLSAFESADGVVHFGNGSEGSSLNRWEGGLVRYRPAEGGFIPSRMKPPSVPFRVSGITEDPSGALVTSGPGLHWITAAGDQRIPIPNLEFPGWWVDHMARGPDGALWLCAWGRGVYEYRGGEWRRFTESDGLVSNRTVFALPSRDGNGLWVTTQRGVSRFDGQSWTTVFPFADPITRESSTLVETATGELWMNFAPRNWYFRTEQDPAGPGGVYTIKYVPERNVPQVELVQVPSSRVTDGDLYFEWAGSDFWEETPVEALEYSFRITGTEWSPFADRRQVILADLEVGDYLFEVRVRDRDWNVSTESARHAFAVVAPLWKRPWFIATTASTIALIIFLVVLIVRNRIKHLLEIEDLKIQFFTYLSHELRTPLAVVLGPIESAMKQVEDSAVLEKLRLAKRNANRVLSLVDQLLDFRKFEYSRKPFHPHPSNLQVFLHDAIESIRPLSEEKHQELELEGEWDQPWYAFDPEMLQKICNNLIGNAIKYSPEGSAIAVRSWIEEAAEPDQEPRLLLTVTDEGPGIAPDSQRLVFEPFYRVNREGFRGKGTGLGLALVKELVDAWGGSIVIESPVTAEGGTRFKVVLPVGVAGPPAAPAEPEPAAEEDGLGDDPGQTRDLVLVVDDDADFRTFIGLELAGRFRVLLAKDGSEGLRMARENMPGVIVSDFHMPGMSGESLSRALKEDVETCHIPIIMLSSDRSQETELAGIKGFADEFLCKPVNLDLFLARLEAVLESRRRLRELFSRQLKVAPGQVTVTSSDEQLLAKAIALVEDNMQDDDFDVDHFSKKMAMSSRTLYRKLKAITGVTPVQFIRAIRLKRAAQLFQGGVTSVSDVMVQVGILDASYFSRTFKKEFGKSPRQYLTDLSGKD